MEKPGLTVALIAATHTPCADGEEKQIVSTKQTYIQLLNYIKGKRDAITRILAIPFKRTPNISFTLAMESHKQ